MSKNALLIIDAQNSFCHPQKGELYVPNAENDMQKLAQWIVKNKEFLDFILITLDTHYYNDISHPNFWRDKNGNKPEPFTQITYDDVLNEKWLPIEEKQRVLDYLKRLEQQKEYVHTIWPPHCIIGSEGAALYKPVLDALLQWSEQGKDYFALIKGTYKYSEHFGAFAAQVQFDDAPQTAPNLEILDKLAQFDKIFVSGEAKSHCVATTIKQIIKFKPQLVEKLYILEDTMSNVPGFEHIADNIYLEAKNLGAKFITTENHIF